MSNLKYLCIIFGALLLSPGVFAQEIEKTLPSADSVGIISPSILGDTIPSDTIPPAAALADSIPADSTQKVDSIAMRANSDVKTTIEYNAEDSIYFDVANQIIHMYGDAHIDYGDVSLDAAYIQLDWVNNTLIAEGMPDSTGQIAGKPVFKEGSEEYQTENIKYNFKTRRAYITNVLTKPQEAEGYVYGEAVKKNEFDEVFIDKGWYTTCDCEPGEVPDFYIQSKKLKVVPGNLVVSGPFNIVIADIPTPLGLPFGIFPMPRRQNSGIIVPTYGEERRRGFFLRNGGYYFDINDYVNLTLLGEIYSKGSYGFQVMSDYNVRYKYSGGLNFQFNRQRQGIATEDDDQVSNDFRLTYRHTPVARGNSRFSASVNIATSSFIQNNPSPNVYNNLRTTLSSTVSYSTAFRNSPFNLSLGFRHNQNLLTDVFNVTLPELSLNMNRIYPLRNLAKSNTSWLSKVNMSYQLTGSNRLTNDVVRVTSRIPDAKIANLNPLADSVLAINGSNLSKILDRTQISFRHSIPVSTSFNLMRFFTVSPSFNYEELWYFKQLDYNFLPNQNQVRIDTIPGFNRVYSWNLGAGTTTRLYGLFTFKGDRKIQAIRHTLIPSIGFSYRPDFSDPRYGYYEQVQIDTTRQPITGRNGRVEDLNKPYLYLYEGLASGSSGPSSGRSGAISFSLNNNLEMKVRNDKDTAQDAEPTRKIPILESFSLSTSYNLISDSFKLAPINVSARTRLFNNKINISASMNVDPYSYDLDPRGPIFQYDTLNDGSVYEKYVKVDRYAWKASETEGGGFIPKLGTVTSANISFNTNLNPKKREQKQETIEEAENAGLTAEEVDYVSRNYDDFVDFDIPWSLSLRYSLSYSFDPRRRLIREATVIDNYYGYSSNNSNSRIRQSIMFNGDLNVAPKWKIGFQSGYDLQEYEITQTSINVFRDLGCFEMRFDWVPFGRYTSYYVQINVKSSMLSDLKLQRRRTWRDF